MINDYNYNIALQQFIFDPKNPHYNFTLGRFYEEEGHTASASSFYIRTTEFGDDELLSYEALLRLSLCLSKQGSRTFMVKGILLRAVALLPDRPEAYFLLSRTYEYNKDWQEAYTWANLGLKLSKKVYEPLKTNVEYPGFYGFTFEKAVTGWWIGLYDESLHLFRQLNKNPNMESIYIQSVKNNLNNLINYSIDLQYDEILYERLKIKFPESIKIKRNYSQSYQDMFILTMLNGKQNGTYVEIGCGEPYYKSNTVLLEENFNWSGISIDIDEYYVNEFNKVRKSKAICADATKLNYNTLLEKNTYDYLQIDCDPPIISYQILLKIPFELCKFAVITFEHDHYLSESSEIKEKSRKYLSSFGYVLCVGDIGCNKYNSYEDWWVHPDLVSQEIINKMQDVSNNVKRGADHMLNKF